MNGRVLSWATDLDERTAEQAARLSEMPFIHQHLALMPDAHLGKGATVGSVIATKGAIIPSAVGVDIGCGMIAARVEGFTSATLGDNLDALHSKITELIPAGVGQGHAHSVAVDDTPYTSAWDRRGQELMKRATTQMGTLGSGNHFVEVCLDENDAVWVVLHSGSRGVGNLLAQHHIDVAKGVMRDYFINLADPDLAYLVEGTAQFDEYISDMLWAQDYARDNRQAMLDAVHDAFLSVFAQDVKFTDVINCHHNYTTREHHMGKNLWVTRKGAINARSGTLGVIPGSMGTRSYIVEGLGNAASFCSCSHGAGRRHGRKAAERLFTPESLTEAMKGKAWNNDPVGLLDEHPGAYKDIDEVMEAQKDLVKPLHTLSQVLNYKGK